MRLGPRSVIGLAWVVTVACDSPTATPTRSPAHVEHSVEEIDGPVAPPGSHVVDVNGERRLAATADQLRAAGDYYYRSGEYLRAREFYAACSSAADGELRAACHWAIGTTLVAQARHQAVVDIEREQTLGLPSRPSGSRECTPAAGGYDHALALLRVAQREHTTARRARVIAALYEEIGRDVDALEFYGQAQSLDPDDPNLAPIVARLRSREPRPECRPPNCPELPFDWHRRTGELEVLGSGLDGASRERVFACFGEPGEFSPDTWIYWRGSCLDDGSATTTIRLRFDDHGVDRVTHERIVEDRDCGLSSG